MMGPLKGTCNTGLNICGMVMLVLFPVMISANAIFTSIVKVNGTFPFTVRLVGGLSLSNEQLIN